MIAARPAPGPPSAVVGEVARGRLVSLLAGRFDRPVTALVAGAGFGKTTLLAQALRHNLAEPLGIDAWVSCQPDDEDPVQFAAACCEALSPGGAAAARGRGEDVIAAIRQLSPIDVCLVVDDIHQIAGSASARLLAEIVPRLPSNGHIMLSGRTSSDVPLARLRLTGHCVEIGERELAFTPAEERDLARQLDVRAPRRELAGWPALVRLTLTSQGSLAHQFLWEEIVGGLRPAEARILLALALVGWADAATLSSICAEHVETGRLTAKIPLLTVSDNGIMSAHDLWAESLERLFSRDQIEAVLPAVREALRARHDALRLAALAVRVRDMETTRVAARELVRHTMAALPVRRARALLAAADPADHDAPELLLLRAAIAHAIAVDDPAITPMVTRATAAFSAAGDEPGEIAALALAGLVASSRGAYADFLQIALRVAELPSAKADAMLQVHASLVSATLAELGGDLPAALDALSGLPDPGVSHPIREPAARLRVYMLVLAGRADEAVPIAEAALRTSSHAHIRKTPPFVRWSAGDPAEIDALRADEGMAPDTNARDQFFYAALAMYVSASTGDMRRLSAQAGLLDALPVNTDDPRDAAMLTAATVMRLVAMHREDDARRELSDLLSRYPVTDARCDVQLRRALAPVYLLEPAVRPGWDTARLGRCHQRMHDVARALLSARAGGPGRGGLLPEAAEAVAAALEDTDALITMLPLPLSVELAVRAHGHGLPAGVRAADLLQRRLGANVPAELRWQRDNGDELVRRAAGELLESGSTGPLRKIRVEVLGPSRVQVDDAPVQSAAGRRARVRQLLALLAVEPNLRRDRAMALLWPDLDQAAASRNLRVTLTYLRQLFRDHPAGDQAAGEPAAGEPASGGMLDERFLLIDSSSIRLVAHPCLEVDLWQLDAHLAAAAQARAAGSMAEHAGALAAAAALWQGEPLVDLQEIEELAGEVTRVRTALVDCTLALGEVRLSEGRAADAVRCAQAVLAADAYNERAHRLAIATQIQLGDHTAATAAARRMHEAFAEVGTHPSDTTKILLRRIAAAAAAR